MNPDGIFAFWAEAVVDLLLMPISENDPKRPLLKNFHMIRCHSTPPVSLFKDMKMNRFVLLFLAVSTASLADDPIACVDPEFADAFLGGWSRDPHTYSTSVPDNFPNLNVPDRFTLVGSQVTDSYSSVVYKTEIGTEAALLGAIRTMTDAGWTKMKDRGTQTSWSGTATG
jgi:hypothetical protein